MDLAELLPDYPEISSPEFYQDLYLKKEFNYLKSGKKVGKFYPWQLVVSRFISNWTLYQSLILIHDTGVGKSGSAAAAFDGLKKFNPYLQTLYITNNDTSLDNFKKEIFKLSPLLYDPKVMDSENYVSKRNSILSKAGFTFTTYYKFAMEIKKESSSLKKQWEGQLIIMDEIHHLVSHDVEIPVEIRIAEKAKAKTKNKIAALFKSKDALKPYDEILAFLDKLTFKKMLLMTATPMRNSPTEIAPLLNLVLPKTEKLPIGEAFVKEYFNSEANPSKIPLLTWKTGKDKKFLEKCKGYISVVKQKVDVDVEYMGNIYAPMKYFKLVAAQMEKIQMKGYKRAYLKDTSSKAPGSDSTSFYSHSQQASLFVFPNFMYGIRKENKYIKDGSFTKDFVKETGMIPFINKKPIASLTAADLKILQDNLAILRTMSSTYAGVIQQLLENRTKQMYIYCDKINGSGILLCIQLLTQFFGYSQLSSPKKFVKKEAPRIIYLHDVGKDTTKADIQLLIDEFNHPENTQGRYIQAIFGTDKTREGISLRRIEQIHICSSDWNFGKIFQAMGRGIRLQSHAGMPPGTKVEIFMHCAVPSKSRELEAKIIDVNQEPEQQQQQQQQQEQQQQQVAQQQGGAAAAPPATPADQVGPTGPFTRKQLLTSIDFYRYYRSELKDINIKIIEYPLLRSAMDCQINKKHNSRRRFTDGSPQCMYQDCKYKCVGIPSNIDSMPIDTTTYNLYYLEEFFQKTIDFIKELFTKKTILHLNDILAEAEAKSFTKKQVIDTLSIILNEPRKITFFDGRQLYLNAAQDTFYLSENRVQIPDDYKKQLWLADYSKNPAFNVGVSFSALLESLQDHQIDKICGRLKDLYAKKDKKGALETLELFSEKTRNVLYLQIASVNDARATPFLKWIRDLLVDNNVLFQNEQGQVLYKKPNGKLYKINDTKTEWVQAAAGGIAPKAPTQQDKIDHEDQAFVAKYIEGKIVYAFFEEGVFKIRDVSKSEEFTDRKKATKGRECSSHGFPKLLFFLYSIYPEMATDAELDNDAEKIKTRDEVIEMASLKSIKQKAKSFINFYEKFLESIGKTDANVTKKDLQFLLFYFMAYNGHRREFCLFLQKIFKQQGFLVNPPLKNKEQVKKEPKKRGRKPTKTK